MAKGRGYDTARDDYDYLRDTSTQLVFATSSPPFTCRIHSSFAQNHQRLRFGNIAELTWNTGINIDVTTYGSGRKQAMLLITCTLTVKPLSEVIEGVQSCLILIKNQDRSFRHA